jgi:hypothetical protein
MNKKLGTGFVVVAVVAVTLFAGCIDELPLPTPTQMPSPTPTHAVTPTPTPVFAPEGCVDGTIDGDCSSLKPKYCDKGVLVDNCSKCGCPPGTLCNYSKGCCFSSSACFPSNAQPQLVRGQYLGVGRVLNAGYAYEFDPSEYDPDNPTGYNTGQWIDVEVIEGKMGCRDPGTIIRGVWSYGGDTGIVGKPKEGDLVGYYEAPYCNIWEKIDNKFGVEKTSVTPTPTPVFAPEECVDGTRRNNRR